MCNEAARRTALGLMREDFSQLKIPLRFPEGLPNRGEVPHIRTTHKKTGPAFRPARLSSLQPLDSSRGGH